MKPDFSVSIIIVTVNRADSLDRTLQSLQQIRYENFEVIVVDGPSIDHTQEIISKHAQSIRAFVNPVRNISAARNTGIAHAKGDIIVFIDDDAIPEPDWLENLLAPYEDPSVVSVGGFIRDPTGYEYQCKYTVVDRYGNAQNYDNRADFEINSEFLFSLTGTNYSTRRANLLSIGGFDEEYVAFLDETDVNIRMADRGWMAVVVSNAEIVHKFEEGYVRQKSPVPRTMYPQLRSKAYFCVVHNRGRRPLSAVINYLGEYTAKEREWKRDLLRAGLADEKTVDRLISEVEQGIHDGVYDAMRLAGPVGIAEDLLAEGQSTMFKRFSFKLPVNQRLRICLLSREYPPNGNGGIGQWSKELAEGLARMGHEVTVLSSCTDGKPLINFVNGVWTHSAPFVAPSDEEAEEFAPAPRSLINGSWSLYKEITRINNHRNFQIIGAPIADLEALVCMRKCEIPVVISLHTTYKLSLPFKPDWLGREEYLRNHVMPTIECEGIILSEAEHIVANSRTIVTDIAEAHEIKIASGKVEIIPHGLEDISAGVLPSRSDAGRVNLLFVGRLEERKGADLLLDAVPKLLSKYPELMVHIVGDDRIQHGPSTFRKVFENEHSGNRALLDRVVFYGVLPRDQLLRQYAACDIFVAPSKYESFGLIYIEAMCFGKPVVALKVGGASEIIEDGVTGFLVAPDQPETLVDSIGKLVIDSQLRNFMGVNARSSYEARFTTRLMAERFEFLYRGIVAKGNRGV